ncbi:MAG TPA: hypothetical protein VKB08_04515 [Bradyrhizobium sp.]|nr:hypothetical protein [Bradyrhizobium sp.]
MADDEQLKPADFPVHSEQGQIVTNDGKAMLKRVPKKRRKTLRSA